jgi:hypothetical protein
MAEIRIARPTRPSPRGVRDDEERRAGRGAAVPVRPSPELRPIWPLRRARCSEAGTGARLDRVRRRARLLGGSRGSRPRGPRPILAVFARLREGRRHRAPTPRASSSGRRSARIFPRCALERRVARRLEHSSVTLDAEILHRRVDLPESGAPRGSNFAPTCGGSSNRRAVDPRDAALGDWETDRRRCLDRIRPVLRGREAAEEPFLSIHCTACRERRRPDAPARGAMKDAPAIVRGGGMIALRAATSARGSAPARPVLRPEARCDRSAAVAREAPAAPIVVGACYLSGVRGAGACHLPGRPLAGGPRGDERRGVTARDRTGVREADPRRPEQYFWLHDRYRGLTRVVDGLEGTAPSSPDHSRRSSDSARTRRSPDLKKRATYPLASRPSLVRARRLLRDARAAARIRGLRRRAARHLRGKHFKELVDAHRRGEAAASPSRSRSARTCSRSGSRRCLIDLMRRGVIDHVAMNSAGAIHDFEIATVGPDVRGRRRRSSRRAASASPTRPGSARRGRALGCAPPPARSRASAARSDACCSTRARRTRALGQRGGRAPRLGVTIHACIGADIVHMHPAANGATSAKRRSRTSARVQLRPRPRRRRLDQRRLRRSCCPRCS